VVSFLQPGAFGAVLGWQQGGQACGQGACRKIDENWRGLNVLRLLKDSLKR